MRRTATEEPVVVGLYGAGSHGWRRILVQEGLPFATDPDGSCPIIVSEQAVPDWLESYLSGGGVFVLSNANDLDGLLPAGPLMAVNAMRPATSVHPVVAPCLARVFPGRGFGEIRLHEDRVTKNGIVQDVFPVFAERSVGAGYLIYTGLPLSGLLTSQGDRLRSFCHFSAITERVANVDKALVADVMVDMVRAAFAKAPLPYVSLSRFPGQVPSVFILRVDVDGAFDGRTMRLAKAAESSGVRASFFVNAVNCERWAGELPHRGSQHELGQHGFVHNLFNSVEENIENLRNGARWLSEHTSVEPRSFVAPRGLWNDALDQALAAEGYAYSSDFGLDFDSLPFRTSAGVLQVPVHPYSPERAARYAEERGSPAPTADAITKHYVRVMEVQQRARRPVHLYGHPEVLGAHADAVVPALAREARSRGLLNMTLEEYARWWTDRESAGMRLRWRSEERTLHVRFDGDGTWSVDAEPSPHGAVAVVSRQTTSRSRVGRP